MSNSPTIKLYTEQQVTELTTAAFLAGQNHNPVIFGVAFEKITPIEIPSDEDIEEMGKDVIVYNDTKRGWFVEGLRFMRDKIGGNK